MKKTIGIVLALLLVASAATAQNLDDKISSYGSKNAELYLQPLADAFGASLNSGFFHTARIGKFGLHVKIGVIAMVAPIPEEKKIFEMVDEPQYGFYPDPGEMTATVFGDEDGGATVNGVEFPGGAFETDYMPLAVPQVTVGGVLGTEATLRYITYTPDDEIGEIKLFGWGVRHSLSQYIPLCPVDIAAGFWRQRFEVGDIVEATATYFGVQASKSLSVLTLYAGAGLEKSSLDIAYDYDNEGQIERVTFGMEGENSSRVTLGLALDLAVLQIFGDINMAKQTTYSAGVTVGF